MSNIDKLIEHIKQHGFFDERQQPLPEISALFSDSAKEISELQQKQANPEAGKPFQPVYSKTLLEAGGKLDQVKAALFNTVRETPREERAQAFNSAKQLMEALHEKPHQSENISAAIQALIHHLSTAELSADPQEQQLRQVLIGKRDQLREAAEHLTFTLEAQTPVHLFSTKSKWGDRDNDAHLMLSAEQLAQRSADSTHAVGVQHAPEMEQLLAMTLAAKGNAKDDVNRPPEAQALRMVYKAMGMAAKPTFKKDVEINGKTESIVNAEKIVEILKKECAGFDPYLVTAVSNWAQQGGLDQALQFSREQSAHVWEARGQTEQSMQQTAHALAEQQAAAIAQRQPLDPKSLADFLQKQAEQAQQALQAPEWQNISELEKKNRVLEAVGQAGLAYWTKLAEKLEENPQAPGESFFNAKLIAIMAKAEGPGMGFVGNASLSQAIQQKEVNAVIQAISNIDITTAKLSASRFVPLHAQPPYLGRSLNASLAQNLGR